jgi:hypothetical protein
LLGVGIDLGGDIMKKRELLVKLMKIHTVHKWDDLDGLVDLILDLLGVPADNTCDFDYCTVPVWPLGCFCRDWWYEQMYYNELPEEKFIDFLEQEVCKLQQYPDSKLWKTNCLTECS